MSPVRPIWRHGLYFRDTSVRSASAPCRPAPVGLLATGGSDAARSEGGSSARDRSEESATESWREMGRKIRPPHPGSLETSRLTHHQHTNGNHRRPQIVTIGKPKSSPSRTIREDEGRTLTDVLALRDVFGPVQIGGARLEAYR